MTNKEILQADMLDILFEHRNKSYGAYALRREYNLRLAKALGFSLASVLFFLLFSFFKYKEDSNNNPLEKDKGVVLSIVDIDEPPKPEPPRPQPQPPVATVDHQPIIVVPDNLADPYIAEQDVIQISDMGNENANGKPSDGIAKPHEESNSNGTALSKEKEPETTIFDPHEKNASFPGGAAAWLKFLERYLQAPDDLEAGERKQVLVRFWIDIDGSISKFEIVQSGGAEFDKEVIRVMKKMPKWEAAEQNGRKVAVAFTQPVIFVGVEE